MTIDAAKKGKQANLKNRERNSPKRALKHHKALRLKARIPRLITDHRLVELCWTKKFFFRIVHYRSKVGQNWARN